MRAPHTRSQLASCAQPSTAISHIQYPYLHISHSMSLLQEQPSMVSTPRYKNSLYEPGVAQDSRRSNGEQSAPSASARSAPRFSANQHSSRLCRFAASVRRKSGSAFMSSASAHTETLLALMPPRSIMS